MDLLDALVSHTEDLGDVDHAKHAQEPIEWDLSDLTASIQPMNAKQTAALAAFVVAIYAAYAAWGRVRRAFE